jgi:hypothetical protein
VKNNIEQSIEAFHDDDSDGLDDDSRMTTGHQPGRPLRAVVRAGPRGEIAAARERVPARPAPSRFIRPARETAVSAVWIDGQFYDRDQASISVFDHGLLYGDGVFEGVRAYGAACSASSSTSSAVPLREGDLARGAHEPAEMVDVVRRRWAGAGSRMRTSAWS